MKTRFPSRILVVDDEELSRRTLVRALTGFGHDVREAADGVEAQARMRLGADLLLLDADMPRLDGFEVATRIREQREGGGIPILMVTGLEGDDHRLRAISAGVDDFLGKPVDLLELFTRTEALLRTSGHMTELRASRESLLERVSELETSLARTVDDLADARRMGIEAHLSAIEVLVHAAEFKDADTVTHQTRMRGYAEAIARGMQLAPRQVQLIRVGASMHDVGKLGIPDEILQKPGRLTPDERRVMQDHTVIGERILHFGEGDELRIGRRVARSHHERWDGGGYPDGLAGEAIPIEARICAVADVFDALTMHRVYREAMSADEAVERIRKARGTHFDPQVVDAFDGALDRILEIRASLSPDPFLQEDR